MTTCKLIPGASRGETKKPLSMLFAVLSLLAITPVWAEDPPPNPGNQAATPERPFAGSCNATVTRLTEPGVFPEVLHVDLECLMEHLGQTIGKATTTVVPAGPPVGTTLPVYFTSETTYEAANGDILNQKFAGAGEVDLATLEVTFHGTETFVGGTGRFVDASGISYTAGTASFVTNTGFLTTKGTLAY